MKRRAKARRSNLQKTKVGLPDLEHVKSAVLVSLRSPEPQRSYRRSIDDLLVLLGALAVFQQNGRDSGQNSPRRSLVGSRHDKRQTCKVLLKCESSR